MHLSSEQCDRRRGQLKREALVALALGTMIFKKWTQSSALAAFEQGLIIERYPCVHLWE